LFAFLSSSSSKTLVQQKRKHKKNNKQQQNKNIKYKKVGLQIECPTPVPDKGNLMSNPNLPQPLTLEEKKYLLAVERGDLATVRR
jgi:hypothetical protein